MQGHALAVYGDKSTGPRPESYLEDILTAQYLETEKEKEAMWSELKAGAESGKSLLCNIQTEYSVFICNIHIKNSFNYVCFLKFSP